MQLAAVWIKTRRDDELDEFEDAIEQSRRALTKNLIRLLSVQDHRGCGFRRPALPFFSAHRRSRWSSLDDATEGEGKTIGVIDWWLISDGTYR